MNKLQSFLSINELAIFKAFKTHGLQARGAHEDGLSAGIAVAEMAGQCERSWGQVIEKSSANRNIQKT
jgi:predicted NAD/FAD-binding protein